MERSEVVAAVVAYQSDAGLLRSCLAAAAAQVGRVVVVDNGAGAGGELLRAEAAAGRADLVANPSNAGVSKALNQALDRAEALGAVWVLLLDQDTEVDPRLVEVLTRSVPDDVAVVCPRVVDRNLDGPLGDQATGSGAEREVDHCITSGALYRVAACRAIGGYDEDIFVDFVDFDLCLRLRAAGHRLLQRDDAVVEHAIGASSQHLGLMARNHSAARCYHIARDTLHYAYKHRRQPRELRYGGRGVVRTYLHLAKKAAVVAAFEEHKAAKLSALARGSVAASREALGRSLARRRQV